MATPAARGPSFRIAVWPTLLGTGLLLILSRLYGMIFFNTRHYFSFVDIATSRPEDVSLLGVAAKLLLPVLSGFAVAFVVKRGAAVEAAASGFLGSFLLSWPFLYFPDVRDFMLPVELSGRKVVVVLIFGLFILTYTLLGRLGASIWELTTRVPIRGKLSNVLSSLNLKDAVRNIVLSLIGALLWQLVLMLAE
jgi:hypothetical protein